MITINTFDEITDFKTCEDEEFIVEYILADNNGFCHRASVFLMSVGTVFEHEFGTYEVREIIRNLKHIVVYCEHITNEHPKFDLLHSLKKKQN